MVVGMARGQKECGQRGGAHFEVAVVGTAVEDASNLRSRARVYPAVAPHRSEGEDHLVGEHPVARQPTRTEVAAVALLCVRPVIVRIVPRVELAVHPRLHLGLDIVAAGCGHSSYAHAACGAKERVRRWAGAAEGRAEALGALGCLESFEGLSGGH